MLQERSFQKGLSFSYYLFLRLGNINSGYPQRTVLYLKHLFSYLHARIKIMCHHVFEKLYDCFCFVLTLFFSCECRGPCMPEPLHEGQKTPFWKFSVLHLVGTGLSILLSYCILQIITCAKSPHSTVCLLSLSRSARIRDLCHPNKLSPGFRNPILVKACTISAFTHYEISLALTPSPSLSF